MAFRTFSGGSKDVYIPNGDTDSFSAPGRSVSFGARRPSGHESEGESTGARRTKARVAREPQAYVRDAPSPMKREECMVTKSRKGGDDDIVEREAGCKLVVEHANGNHRLWPLVNVCDAHDHLTQSFTRRVIGVSNLPVEKFAIPASSEMMTSERLLEVMNVNAIPLWLPGAQRGLAPEYISALKSARELFVEVSSDDARRNFWEFRLEADEKKHGVSPDVVCAHGLLSFESLFHAGGFSAHALQNRVMKYARGAWCSDDTCAAFGVHQDELEKCDPIFMPPNEEEPRCEPTNSCIAMERESRPTRLTRGLARVPCCSGGATRAPVPAKSFIADDEGVTAAPTSANDHMDAMFGAATGAPKTEIDVFFDELSALLIRSKAKYLATSAANRPNKRWPVDAITTWIFYPDTITRDTITERWCDLVGRRSKMSDTESAFIDLVVSSLRKAGDLYLAQLEALCRDSLRAPGVFTNPKTCSMYASMVALEMDIVSMRVPKRIGLAESARKLDALLVARSDLLRRYIAEYGNSNFKGRYA